MFIHFNLGHNYVHNFSLELPTLCLTAPFHMIILPILFYVNELQYNHVLTL